MPIYEFVCQSCNNEFEKIQSFSDPSVPVCPNCSGADVERQMGRPAIHFKGSGWYINDSKKANKGSANGKSKNGADKEKKTTGKSDGEGAKSGAKETAGASSSSSSEGSSGAGNKAGNKAGKGSTGSSDKG